MEEYMLPTPQEGHPADILVVDDQPEITDLLSDILADEGYVVRVATNGAGALKAIAAREPDLLLIDVSMPVLSGDVAVERLRQVGYAHMPIIVMTAGAAPERLRGYAQMRLLRKPFELARLMCTVKQALSEAPRANQ